MNEASRWLCLAGALPYLLLGLAHARATPTSPEQEKGLSPRSPDLRAALERETVLLTRRTSLWRAWVGFNFSHSLGAVAFALALILVARSPASYEGQAGVFLPLAVVVSGLYLVLAVRYWFRVPLAGTALASACLLAALLLHLTGS